MQLSNQQLASCTSGYCQLSPMGNLALLTFVPPAFVSCLQCSSLQCPRKMQNQKGTRV